MAATYYAKLRKHNEDGTQDVYLVLTVARKPAYLSLGFSVLPKHWNKAASLQKPLWVRSANLAAIVHNATIRTKLELAAAWITARPTLTSTEWRDKVKSGLDPGSLASQEQEQASAHDFLVFFAQEVDRRRIAGKIRTAERLQNILNKLREYQGWVPRQGDAPELPPRPLPYTDLSARYVADYRAWVTGVKGNKGQTPDKELAFIKTILRLAIDEGYMPAQKNPFANIKFSTPAARKVKLTEEEVQRLERVALPATPGLQYARDTWLLQYFLYGSRIADVLLLRWADVGDAELSFQEQKTGKWKAVGRSERLDLVLERLRRAAVSQRSREVKPSDFVVPLLSGEQWYTQFPPHWSIADLEASRAHRAHYEQLLKRLASCTAKTNYYLKSAAHHAGIAKHITTHVARHSFAAMARRSQVSSFDLRDMLGHHSVALTERYAGELERDELSSRAGALYQRRPGTTDGPTPANSE